MRRIVCVVCALICTGCASHRQVKVNCSSHLVRINASEPIPVVLREPVPSSLAPDEPRPQTEEQP